MHRANLTIIVTIPVLLLAATVAISVMVSEDVFARSGKYTGDTSQAASVSNECITPIFDSNTIDNAVGVGNCGGTVSQQDESGSAAAPITSQTANPTIELQRSTTSQPVTGEQDPVTTCVNCFNGLTDAERTEFEQQLPIQVDDTVTTIEELCEYIDQNRQDASGILGNVQIILQDELGLQPTVYNPIITCLVDAFNL